MDYKARMTSLKDRLAGMTPTEHKALLALHELLAEVKKNPRSMKYDPAAFVQDIEFTMQGLWGFTRDAAYHTHWIEVEGCMCPMLENHDRVPFGKIINLSCPWHGTKEEV